jgi:hypothetical protein
MESTFLVMILRFQLDFPAGSSWVARLHSPPAANLTCGPFGILGFMVSSFFLGLPLLQGSFFLEEEAPAISLFYMNLSISIVPRLDLVSSVSERMVFSTSLGMVIVGAK